MQLQQQWQRQRGWASAEVRSGGGYNGVRCTRSGRSRRRSSWLVGGRHASSPWVSAVAVGLGGSQCIANAARQLACIVGVSSSLPYASAAHGPITW